MARPNTAPSKAASSTLGQRAERRFADEVGERRERQRRVARLPGDLVDEAADERPTEGAEHGAGERRRTGAVAARTAPRDQPRGAGRPPPGADRVARP